MRREETKRGWLDEVNKNNKMQSETMPAGPRKKDQTNEPFYDFNVRGEIWECATGCRSLLVNHFLCWMVVQKMSAAFFLMASAFIKQVANKNFQPQLSGPISLTLRTWLFHVM